MNGERVARPYSFVNSPGATPLEFYYAIVAQGPLSPRLARLNAGDRVFLAANPAGFLVLSEVPEADNLWLISTGTGIGPFLSILGSQPPWRRFRKVVLVHAVRHPSELVYGEVLAAIERARGDQFTCVRVTSRGPSRSAMA